jgi:hypothetical protein
MRIGDFGMRIGDCGLRVKAVYNAFRGSWSDFLGAVGVSVVSGYFRGLYAIPVCFKGLVRSKNEELEVCLKTPMFLDYFFFCCGLAFPLVITYICKV